MTEKALRVFLFSQGKEIVLGHSVARLCGKAAEYQAGFSENEQRLSLLDAYYIPTCYPNGLPDGIATEVYTKEAAKSVMALANDAMTYVKGLID